MKIDFFFDNYQAVRYFQNDLKSKTPAIDEMTYIDTKVLFISALEREREKGN